MNSSRICALVLLHMGRMTIAVDGMIIRGLLWLSTDAILTIGMNRSKTTIRVTKDWTNRRIDDTLESRSHDI